MKNTLFLISLLAVCTHTFSQSTATYIDDFKSNKNNWLICNNSVLSTAITPTGYAINNKGNSHQSVYHHLPLNLNQDFVMEATITRDLNKDNYGFGVVFGGSNPGDVYEFLIEVTGAYTVFKYNKYEYEQIIPWTYISGINPLGTKNTLKIESKMGTAHFFINGVEVNQVKNLRLRGGLHGFSLGKKSKVTVNAFKFTYVPVKERAVTLDTTLLPRHFILNEDFDNNYMQWDLHAGHSELKNGYYELSNPGESYLFWEDYSMLKVRDYAVETELTLVKGNHSAPYGLMLGIKGGSGDYLEFSITANGFVRLSKHVDWESEPLVPWTFCSSIKSNAANSIVASRRNDSLYFYINQKLATKFANVELAGNGVGWILVEGINKVNVNYIRIRQPLQVVTAVADIAVSDRQRLSENVNSSSEEFSPVVSPDGNTLYFTRDDNPDIHGLEKDDIFYCVLKDNQWGPATKMPAPLNNKGDCAVISASTDNQTLLLRGDFGQDEKTDKEELYISHLTKDGWEKPAKVIIDGYKNTDNDEDFCLSSNKTILISSFENDASLGERDLFVSFLQPDSSWSTPQNLGKTVNTSSNDFSPFLAADNMTLYYSSYGMPSYGKADIYVTRRLDDTWRNWSPPQNLGNVVNTELNDQGFAVAASGTEAYLSSEQNTIGKADLFKVKLPPPLQPQPVVLIYGKVFDSTTGLTMETEIVYDDLRTDKESGKTRSNAQSGDYRIILPYGEHYGLNANQEGYMPLSENVDIVEKKNYQEIHMDLYLIPIRAGQNLVLKNLFFTPGSPEIAMKSYSELRKMAAIIKHYPTMKITIAGHTDDGNGESPRNLQKLSVRRAEAVKSYFVSHGVAEDRIETVGYGKDKPLASNKTEEDRKKNRRVEFTIDVL